MLVCLALVWLVSFMGGTLHVYKLGSMRMEPRWGFCDYRYVTEAMTLWAVIVTSMVINRIFITLYDFQLQGR